MNLTSRVPILAHTMLFLLHRQVIKSFSLHTRYPLITRTLLLLLRRLSFLLTHVECVYLLVSPHRSMEKIGTNQLRSNGGWTSVA